MLYRAVGADNISRFGFAQSDDGIDFQRFQNPRYDPPVNDEFERIGAEDPRISKIGNHYYILFTAASIYPLNDRRAPKASKISISKAAPFRVRAALAITTNFKKIEHKGHLFGDLDTKDAAVFPEKIDGEYYVLHRVYPNLSLSTSPNCLQCRHDVTMAKPRQGKWDSLKIGAGAPPIKTDYGWLLFYHGVDHNKRYHLGMMVLNKNNPRQIIYRSPEPILSPQEPYEKQGNVKNVVFTCGALEWKNHYYVYYGGADKVIALATVAVEEITRAIKKST